ncbi:MAG: hypothetical protein JXA99_17625, partial [Candidatus Lokiarchaeota archaeon]|nr:hypothetical protein [Candidatus Lokiarchaeota archaeon]
EMASEINNFQNQYSTLNIKFDDYTSKISNYVNNIIDYFNQNNELIKKQLENLEKNYSKIIERFKDIENNNNNVNSQFDSLDTKINEIKMENNDSFSKLSKDITGLKIILSSLNEQTSSIMTELYLIKSESGDQDETITRENGDYKIPIFKIPNYKELPEREIKKKAVIDSLLSLKKEFDEENTIGLHLSKAINNTINILTNNLTPRGKLKEFLRPLNADVRRYQNDYLPKGYKDLIKEEIDKIIEFYKSITVIKED